MVNLADDRYCFVCGEKNQIGLKLKFDFNMVDGIVVSKVNFSREFQGWQGIVHGGFIATVLDEIMVKCVEFTNQCCVTAEIKVKYKKPAKILQDYYLSAQINQKKKKIIFANSKMTDQDGRIMAEAEGKLFLIANKGD